MTPSHETSGRLPLRNLAGVIIAGVLAGLSLAASAAPEADPFPKAAATGSGQRALEVFVSFLTGTWNGAPDKQGPADVTPTTLRQARIWAERAGEFWIYAEFVHPEDEARPFRQRIYRIGEGAGLITAIVYRLPGDSIRYAGEWRKPRPFEALSPADLTERKGCRIEIPPGMPIAFAGSTPGRECAPESPGAAYEKIDFLLSPGHLKFWERGFDATGAQVTGSTVGPLNFLRASESAR